MPMILVSDNSNTPHFDILPAFDIRSSQGAHDFKPQTESDSLFSEDQSKKQDENENDVKNASSTEMISKTRFKDPGKGISILKIEKKSDVTFLGKNKM